MIILRSTYVADVVALQAHLEAHLRWVDAGYKRGWFIASGLRDGGVGAAILAQGVEIDEIRDFLEEDPFVRNAVSEYDVIEFEAARTVAELASFS